ncbi:MAG: dUTP diphosphatase [Bacteroidetes bacterium]|nr:dUTP diphosphatase [Bacteroidota bacterium]
MLSVKIVNQSGFELPRYETQFSAGVDLRASILENIVIPSGNRELIGTGLFIELPEGHEAQIRPRSGLALKHGITVLNSPGTIDSDYRGEIKVLLINHGKEDAVIHPGDRIAQMIVSRVEQIKFEEVNTLNTTERGSGGYGHTGFQ